MLVSRLLRTMLWTMSLASIAVFLFLVSRRLGYPLELDYIEGVMMDHIVRLTHGQPIYVAPSLDFITLAYMPGFATVSSLFARVFGTEFWVPRLVSALAMMGNATLVFAVLRRETGNWTLAIAGSGLLLASFGVTGGHYDVARPDSLMLFLALSGLTVLRFTRGARGAMLSALILVLAFFTKQHAVWFLLASMAYLLVNDRMRFWPFALVGVIGCLGGYALLSAWLGPWFSYFTWDIPSHWSQISKVRIFNYLGNGLVGTFGYLTGGVLASLALPDRVWRGPQGQWWWMGLAAIATGMMATLDPDAFRHVLNPSVVVLVILGPLALQHVYHQLSTGSGAARPHQQAIVYLVLCLQFLPLAYPVRGHLPHPRGREALAALEQRIEAMPGRVLMLYHGYYTDKAGKGTTLQQITLDDIARSRGNRVLKHDPQLLVRMFEPLRDGPGRPTIITDVPLERSGSESRALWRSLVDGYQLVDSLGWESAALSPVDGWHWTPRYVYRPRVRHSAPDTTTGSTGATRPNAAGVTGQSAP